MVLRSLEDRLERLVEGVFARAFRTGLQPVEIARRLERDLGTGRTLDARGRAIGPNRFVVDLAPADYARFSQIQDSLCLEFASAVREHAEERSLGFLGRVGVTFAEEEKLVTGRFRVEASFVEGTGGNTAPAFLELTDGRRIALGDRVAVIGRMPESSVYLDDPNVSRRHAELRPDGDTYAVVDLDSTNGTRVNGGLVREHLLADGDAIGVGRHSMIFRLL